jgi:hypothetical protein
LDRECYDGFMPGVDKFIHFIITSDPNPLQNLPQRQALLLKVPLCQHLLPHLLTTPLKQEFTIHLAEDSPKQ